MKEIVVRKNGEIIAPNVTVATKFFERLKGLLGRENLNNGEGMLIYPCKSIHCIGMNFTIDAIFMDRNKKVVGLRPALEPGSTATVYGADYVLEVKNGFIKDYGIKLGDTIEFNIK